MTTATSEPVVNGLLGTVKKLTLSPMPLPIPDRRPRRLKQPSRMSLPARDFAEALLRSNQYLSNSSPRSHVTLRLRLPLPLWPPARPLVTLILFETSSGRESWKPSASPSQASRQLGQEIASDHRLPVITQVLGHTMCFGDGDRGPCTGPTLKDVSCNTTQESVYRGLMHRYCWRSCHQLFFPHPPLPTQIAARSTKATAMAVPTIACDPVKSPPPLVTPATGAPIKPPEKLDVNKLPR